MSCHVIGTVRFYGAMTNSTPLGYGSLLSAANFLSPNLDFYSNNLYCKLLTKLKSEKCGLVAARNLNAKIENIKLKSASLDNILKYCLY